MDVKHLRRLLAIGAVGTALVAVGCGGGEEESSSAAAGDSTSASAGVAAAKERIESLRAEPKFEPPGEPLDARKVAQGKTLLSFPSASAVPFLQTINAGIKRLSGDVGLKFIDWPNQGKPVQWTQAMSAGMDRGVAAINTLALNPDSIAPQIKQAKDKGIPFIASHVYDTGQTPETEGVDVVAIAYKEAGRTLADWAIAQTNGKANVLVVTVNEVPSTPAMVEGIEEQMDKNCPDCKVTKVNVGIAEMGTRTTPQVASALVKDPTINYALPLYDSALAPSVVAAIKQANATDRVKIATFNGTPSVLKMVASGEVEMDLGEPLEWISYANMDQILRLVGGMEPVKDHKIPFRLFDKSNVAEAGTPPSETKGYGDSYRSGYGKLWGLTN
jgi:ribose transport system substrate-binding protein